MVLLGGVLLLLVDGLLFRLESIVLVPAIITLAYGVYRIAAHPVPREVRKVSFVPLLEIFREGERKEISFSHSIKAVRRVIVFFLLVAFICFVSVLGGSIATVVTAFVFAIPGDGFLRGPVIIAAGLLIAGIILIISSPRRNDQLLDMSDETADDELFQDFLQEHLSGNPD